MKITELFKNINYELQGDDVDIQSLQKNSKDEIINGLFFCYNGVDNDGKFYVKQAINNGAVAVVVEEFLDINITQVKVNNVRKHIAKVCSNFYNNPDKELKIIGISGTNGKTTSSYILQNILKVADKKVGVIGTNAVMIGDIFFRATLTTPDPIELFDIFSKMKNAGVEYVVMEVSAHAIDLYKVWGVTFEVGLFTNLTRDHLDYFGNMTRYKETKMRFFCKDYCKKCVFNIDDNAGKEFFDRCDTIKFTYGLLSPADAFAINIKLSLGQSKFVVNADDEIMYIESSLVGKFNVYNILGVIMVAKILGVESDQIVSGIFTLPSVDGRFNLYKVGTKNIVVDFAHTPDGIENVLRTARSITNGDIITVFGCGGNRDKGKRPLMGSVASKYSSKVYLTSDNPRFENPLEIINDIKQGCPEAIVIENRKEAIITAISESANGSLIMILGKGAEDYQDIGGIKHPYTDKSVVEELMLKDKYESNKG